MWSLFVFGTPAVMFAYLALSTMYHLKWAQRLPPLSALTTEVPDASHTPLVRCSVVVAARNEEARIATTVAHILAQQGVQIELIVVNDRSTDKTAEILQSLASDSRLRVKTVELLPDGWLGKCHACHVGAQAATGDWILFTDADCWLKPDVLARALHIASREHADHVALTPGVTPISLGGRAWHLVFLIGLADWFSGVNRDRPKAYMGMGAFNLVHGSAYRACGGYEALCLTVIDDIRLGLLLNRAGKRTRAFIGGDDAECHWGLTAGNMVQLMEKNYFAAMDFRLVAALMATSLGICLWSLAVIGPFTRTPAGLVAGLAVLAPIIPSSILTRRLGWPIAGACFVPLIFPLVFYAMLNSAVVTTCQGGIRWRETFYPLDRLRAERVK